MNKIMINQTPIILILAIFLNICNICNAAQSPETIELSGKILDQDGNLIIDEVLLEISYHDDTTSTGIEGNGPPFKFEQGISTYSKIVSGGVFKWELPKEAIYIAAKASRKGYHDSYVNNLASTYNKKVVDVLLFYLVKEGTPVKLEYVKSGYIPGKEDKKSEGKDCGWSFIKRWYYPIGEEETIWMTKTLDKEGKFVYTMKEPGGFVYFPGFSQRESKIDSMKADLTRMTQAPENGYVQSVRPADHLATGNNGEVFYYFRTPDNKYGKISISVRFSYYVNPSGSRDLEFGGISDENRRRSIETGWLEKEVEENKESFMNGFKKELIR